MNSSIIGAFIIYNSYGLESLSILIGSGNCLGSENSLFSCPYSVLGPGERCSSEAAVICQGEHNTISLEIVIAIRHDPTLPN